MFIMELTSWNKDTVPATLPEFIFLFPVYINQSIYQTVNCLRSFLSSSHSFKVFLAIWVIWVIRVIQIVWVIQVAYKYTIIMSLFEVVNEIVEFH